MLTPLKIGSRASPLAIAQVDEVIKELQLHHPHIQFSCNFIETTGDKDRQTSLRTLDKTDFFTKEIDTMLLSGTCRIGIHSAKDLPAPLPKGLAIAALTKGLDPSDSLVLKPGVNLSNIPKIALIATSSVRREDAVRQLIPHALFKDIRGTIWERLQFLTQETAAQKNKIDGVVIAEAALIRLRLTHLNRLKLPGDTTPLQGQLAIVIRDDDKEMFSLFSCIDSRISI